MDATHAGLTLAIAIPAGVVAQSLARHMRLPSIVLLLGMGVLLGPELLGWVQPSSLGSALFVLVDFAVAVVLFEGGLNLEGSRLRRQERTIRYLITVGAVVTMILASAAAWRYLNWPWHLAFLFGSLVVVTGPTVVTPLLRDLRLRPRLRTILEAEGVLIDPIGAILAVLALQVALSQTVAPELKDLVFRLGFGITAGLLMGFLLGGLLRLRWLLPKGHKNIFTLATVILLFEGCDQVISHSGIFAVTVCGVVVGNLRTPVDRDLREFKDQLTILLVGLIFVLLAADLRIDDVRNLGWPGVAVVGTLVMLIRPLGAWLSTMGSGLPMRERLFIAWIAPRGIVAASLASLAAVEMTRSGATGGAELRALVFLTIAVTVVLAGLTARPVAALLRVRLPSRDRVAILGAHGLGLALGEVLRQADTPAVLLDSDPKRCHEAEEAGFTVVFGNALEERTMLRAQFESVGTAIGLTPNVHLNSLFTNQARQLFGVPLTYILIDVLPGGKRPDHVKQHEAKVLFEGPHDAERWDVRWRHREVVIEPFTRSAQSATARNQDDDQKPISNVQAKEQSVILAIRRDKRLVPMTLHLTPRPGDVAWVAIHVPQHEEAVAKLQETGWNSPAEEIEL